MSDIDKLNLSKIEKYDTIEEGQTIEFLKGSDCPTCKAECLKVYKTGIIEFKNLSPNSKVYSFNIHVENLENELKNKYAKFK